MTAPTTAVNGQPIQLSGTLTDTTTSTPVTNQPVTLTIGSGSTAQSCSGTTDANGNVTCTTPPLNQPVSNVSVTATYPGDNLYYQPTSSTPPTPVTVTEPTTLTFINAQPTTSDFADAVPVSARLTDTLSTLPIAGEPVTFKLNNTDTCTAPTDATGLASCSITPSEPAGTYPLTASFGGDGVQPLQITSSAVSVNFVVTLEQDTLTYTGATIAHNGQPLAVSGVLTTDDPSAGAPIAGRTVTFTLGTGSSAQSLLRKHRLDGHRTLQHRLGEPVARADPYRR